LKFWRLGIFCFCLKAKTETDKITDAEFENLEKKIKSKETEERQTKN